MPPGGFKDTQNQSGLDLPHAAMSFQLSAPLNTAAIEINKPS